MAVVNGKHCIGDEIREPLFRALILNGKTGSVVVSLDHLNLVTVNEEKGTWTVNRISGEPQEYRIGHSVHIPDGDRQSVEPVMVFDLNDKGHRCAIDECCKIIRAGCLRSWVGGTRDYLPAERAMEETANKA